MAKLSLKRPIIFFDLETTGVQPARDRIVELAMIKMLPGGARDTFIKRINPGIPIPPETTAIHGISDDDVKDAPTFKQIAHTLYEWMKGADLAGYNSTRFDIPVLAEEFLRCGINIDFSERFMVDAQQIFFKQEQRNLSSAYKFYCQKELENAHSAEADILATIEVLEGQLEKYGDLSTDVQWLHDYCCDGEPVVDYARAMVSKNGVPVFNIGKHKGQSVAAVFARDPSYYDWMMKADFSLHTKQKISEILNEMKLGKLTGK